MKTCPRCGALNPDDALYCSNCAAPIGGPPPPGQQAPSPPYPSYPPYPYAAPAGGIHYGGFWIRLVAYIIDAIILSILFIPLHYFFPGAETISVLTFCLWVFYYVWASLRFFGSKPLWTFLKSIIIISLSILCWFLILLSAIIIYGVILYI